MLETQQTQLVQGLQELYRRITNEEGWAGEPLRETNGLPLTHDILDRLGALKHDGEPHSAQFEGDFLALQRRMVAQGDSYMPRGMSFDTDSEADQAPSFDPSVHRKPAFTNPFSNRLPPTPPMDRPHSSSVISNSPLKTHTNTSAPQFTQQTPWQVEPSEFQEMDLAFAYDMSVSDINISNLPPVPMQMFQQNTNMAINPCMTMKSWHGVEDNLQQYYQGGVYT